MYLKLLIFGIIKTMSNNVFSGFAMGQWPDNPQEMLKSNYYFSGLMAAEMSCSIIKRTNHHPRGYYYYAIDITVTNADKQLLAEVNEVVMNRGGIITPVKGAYNLSARGKDKVRIVLDFLKRYPIVVGDLAKNRIEIMKTALKYLSDFRGHKIHQQKSEKMDDLRRKLRELKFIGKIDHEYDLFTNDRTSLGHFFAGVIAGEGSFGMKSSGVQPYFAVAMKDKKIIESLSKFIDYGNARLRKDGIYHLEVTRREVLKNLCDTFLNLYPLRHERQKQRLNILQQLLNDYTPKSLGLVAQRI